MGASYDGLRPREVVHKTPSHNTGHGTGADKRISKPVPVRCPALALHHRLPHSRDTKSQACQDTPFRSRLPRLAGHRELHAWIPVTTAVRGARQIRSAPAMRCALARRPSASHPCSLPFAGEAAAIDEPRDASAAAHSPPLPRASPPCAPHFMLLTRRRLRARRSKTPHHHDQLEAVRHRAAAAAGARLEIVLGEPRPPRRATYLPRHLRGGEMRVGR